MLVRIHRMSTGIEAPLPRWGHRRRSSGRRKALQPLNAFNDQESLTEVEHQDQVFWDTSHCCPCICGAQTQPPSNRLSCLAGGAIQARGTIGARDPERCLPCQSLAPARQEPANQGAGARTCCLHLDV